MPEGFAERLGGSEWRMGRREEENESTTPHQKAQINRHYLRKWRNTPGDDENDVVRLALI